MSRKTVRRSLWCWLALSPIVVLVLFPFAVMLSTAVKPIDEVLAYPPRWLPTRLAWENFADMWQAADFGTALLNSLVISILATFLAIAVALPAAYAMSRLPFRGRGLYRQFLLVTQMLSPILLVLGLFRMAAAIPLGDGTLVDTRLGVIIIYGAFNIAFAAWMLASYFATIPRDLEEAAWIDGCNRAGAVLRIFLPVAAPAIAVTAIVTFVASWNEFTVALTMLRDPSKLTLTLRVVNLVAGRYSVQWNQVMAATLLATLPVAVMFAVLQRWLVQGLTLGAVK
ncbi:carbohydrate ABC transporter permease [Limobrevibacterium gyesilva]|uniref:Maltose/maltodextrin transport system permease protein MalG n=1 Tax=Limobrevibacterium gyesilva TaxID=2991712 RepID=A0AA41YS51_9PROT|nr:carbohydrate ABC transporter permease [Limobrevibacterium gyesilva]MCW3477716.1 carbohydrate ABC transporter permease [Limobrevibacterium gyesilva]